MSRFYIVGAGPGRADLLTLRAARILASADVVLHDRLVSAEVLQLARPGAEIVSVGKEEGEQDSVQALILRLFDHYAHSGLEVVRLKGGDPFVFGRGGEEWAYLTDRGCPVEIVPGVSSALSVPALAGIPATFRGISCAFAVITGSCLGGSENDWTRYASVETLIVLMGVSRRASIAAALIRAGRPADEPACFIENGSTPRERIIETTLGFVAAGESQVDSPAVFVIGQVAALRASLRPQVTDAYLPELPNPPAPRVLSFSSASIHSMAS